MPDPCIERFRAGLARDKHLANAAIFDRDANDDSIEPAVRRYCRHRAAHFLRLAAAAEREMLSYV